MALQKGVFHLIESPSAAHFPNLSPLWGKAEREWRRPGTRLENANPSLRALFAQVAAGPYPLHCRRQ
jgi:hypothetical protein